MNNKKGTQWAVSYTKIPKRRLGIFLNFSPIL